MDDSTEVSRRTVLANCGRLAAGLFTVPIWLLFAQRADAAIPRGPVLRERLIVGLRVKTERDIEFIDHVVELVVRRKLPQKLVDQTYFWARTKAAAHRSLGNNPMVYFRPGLAARAAKIGIKV